MDEKLFFHLFDEKGGCKSFFCSIKEAVTIAVHEAIKASPIILSKIGEGPVDYKDKKNLKDLAGEGDFIVHLPDGSSKPLRRASLLEAVNFAREEAVRNSKLKLYAPINWKIGF